MTVVIPTYKHGEFIERAVRSCFDQTMAVSEVWVIDDASPDETPEIMQALCSEFPKLGSLRHSSNRGINISADRGLRCPDAEFVVRLDSDDVLKRRYVEVLSALLVRHERAAYAHAGVEEVDREGKVTRLRRLFRMGGFEQPDDALRACLRGARFAANIQMLVRSALRAVNFLEGAPATAEDYYLSARLADAGYGNVYTPEILAQYRVWGGTQWSDQRRNLRNPGPHADVRRCYRAGLPSARLELALGATIPPISGRRLVNAAGQAIPH